MRRSALITAVVLGALVCLLGGTVLYAALQDAARTGTNSAESAALPSAAPDLQLATATMNGPGPIACGAFADNLASGLVAVSGVTPGYLSPPQYFWLKNAGGSAVTLSAQVEELTDLDIACTGDEAANGDTSCGGEQAGELSGVLQGFYTPVNCQTGVFGNGAASVLEDNQATPTLIPGPLAGGAIGCFSYEVYYPPGTAAAATQVAQSDRATWRIKFSAQA